ncbi:MAG: MFS transporter [Dehalococcoidales bacterium]|nr:MFS transporter [Dehalococcoidales bacterium]
MPGFTGLKKTFHQWGGATTAFFTYTHLSHDLCISLHMALLPLIREDLGLSYLQAGFILSAYQITAGLFQIPGGWLGDRLNRHIVVAIGLGGVGLGALAIGLSSSYLSLLLALVFLGIMAGAYHPAATSLLSSYFEESKRGKVIGLHLVGGSGGFTLGPILGALIAAAMGWHSAFIILSIPALAVMPFVLLKMKRQQISDAKLESKVHVGDTTLAESAPGRSLVQVLRPVAFIMLLAILTQFIAGSAMAFIPLYLVDKHSLSPAFAAMMLGIIRGGGVLGSLLGGWLSDKWGRRNAIFLVLIATGPTLYLLTRLPFNLSLVIIFIIFGIFMQMRQSTVQPFLMDSTPSRYRGIIFGLYFGLSMEGSSMLQPVAGYFMDSFGIISVFQVVALASVGLSLVALLLLKKPHLRR